MKTYIIALSLFTLSLLSCEQENSARDKMHTSSQNPDTSLPVITLKGKKNDTTYLKIVNLDLKLPLGEDRPKWRPQPEEAYCDEGATVWDEKDGDITLFLEITGKVNNRIPGIYFLTYNAKDAAGNKAVPVTRTVYVIKNNADFLNGNYKVTCTCTLVAQGSSNPTITATNYTATIVTSNEINDRFKLSALNIGPQYRTLSPSLKGNILIDDPYSYLNPAEFHPTSSLSGTVSSTKNTFTMETEVNQCTSSVTYTCKNIYTKSTSE